MLAYSKSISTSLGCLYSVVFHNSHFFFFLTSTHYSAHKRFRFYFVSFDILSIISDILSIIIIIIYTISSIINEDGPHKKQ